MKKLHSLLAHKKASFLTSKKMLAYLIAFLFMNIFADCNAPDLKKAQNLNDTGNIAANNKMTSSPQTFTGIDPQLKILYIETPTIVQFIRNTHGKLVFQYFINSNGALTLAVFGGEENHKNFDRVPLVLKVSNVPVAGQVITKNVFLGDQEISRKAQNDPGDLGKFKDDIRTMRPYFITFTPKLTPAVNTTDTIKYEIGYYPDKLDFATLDFDKTLLKGSGLYLNPSPPRNGY